MLIVLNQERRVAVGAITTLHVVDETTGEIIDRDLTAKTGDPVRIGRRMINEALTKYPSATIDAEHYFLKGARCKWQRKDSDQNRLLQLNG